MFLLSRGDIDEGERNVRESILEDSLRLADRDLRNAYDGIKNASPLWHSLITSGGQPVALADAQRRLVPSGGYLLLYQIGPEASTLFLIPPSGTAPEVVELQVDPEDATVLGIPSGPLTADALAKVIGGTTLGEGTAPSSGIVGMLSDTSGARRLGSEALLLRRLNALWRVLTPLAIWPRLVAATQVVVIPGRGLHQFPFEALVVEPHPTLARTRFWLDSGPPIRYAASATTLDNIEQRRSDPSPGQGGSQPVLSLSNPIFDPARIPGNTTGASVVSHGQAQVLDSVPPGEDRGRRRLAALASQRDSSNGGWLDPLPQTAAETDSVRQALGPARVLALQQLDATETRLRAELPGRAIIHLATHAIVDEQRDALFAALALTPPGTLDAAPENDGFLQLHEVYRLPLGGIQLAVLSACRTNVGADVMGEGVFALSRGFHAAGVQRVIGTQWDVADRSTAVLVGNLFRGISSAERRGGPVDYVEALRHAKQRLRARTQWAHPYFWAPFVLTGAR